MFAAYQTYTRQYTDIKQLYDLVLKGFSEENKISPNLKLEMPFDIKSPDLQINLALDIL